MLDVHVIEEHEWLAILLATQLETQQRVGEDVPLMPNQRGEVSATGPALQ